MKRIIIRIAVLLVVFFAALFGTSKLLNQGSADTVDAMESASYPLLYMIIDGTQLNTLHGYAKTMNVMAMRDSLTPVNDDRIVHIKIKPYENQINSISFQVLTADGSESLENTQVKDITTTDGIVEADLEIQNKMLMNTEYIMQIQVTAGSRVIYYYTRLLHQEGLHAKEYLDFTTGFYEACINQSDDAGLISTSIEPSEEGDNTTLAHMNIHCSAYQLMWADLSPQVYYKPTPSIKELNENTATISMDYVVTAAGDSEDDVEMYHVKEYYRMRYTDDRVLLLDFERDTNQLFDPMDDVLISSGINLGVSSKNIEYKNDSQKQFFGFVQEGALWLYATGTQNITQVFSFPQSSKLDARDVYDENDIKIINIDTLGNMYFLVCGYMNRGSHEGQCGVAFYYYDSATTSIKEMLFVETQEAFSLLDKDVDELAYISQDDSRFFVLLEGTLYQIDAATLEMTKIVENVKSGCSAGSKSGQYFAWLEENELYDSKNLNVINLETMEQTQITCKKKQRLQPIAFIGEDLVYGVAKTSEIDTDYKGSEVFPMNKLTIVDTEGNAVKEYKPSGFYVTGGTVSEGLLTLDCVKKTEAGFVETAQDHIVSSTANEQEAYGLANQTSDRKEVEVTLKTGETIARGKKLLPLYAQQIIQEKVNEVSIPAAGTSEELYYVYAKGHLDSIYTNARQAVLRANDELGVVVNNAQQLLWERGNKSMEIRLNIENFPEAVQDGTIDPATLESELGKQVLDLRGCQLDTVLYYVSEGTPVLAETKDGVVIIAGYDEFNTILLKPGDSETYYYGMDDSTALFEESGNIFVTYYNPVE